MLWFVLHGVPKPLIVTCIIDIYYSTAGMQDGRSLMIDGSPRAHKSAKMYVFAYYGPYNIMKNWLLIAVRIVHMSAL